MMIFEVINDDLLKLSIYGSQCLKITFNALKESKRAKFRNRYNQVPHLTQDTNEKVTNAQSDTTNESQEVSPFPAGDHKAHINRHAQRHSRQKTEKHKRSTKEVPPWTEYVIISIKTREMPPGLFLSYTKVTEINDHTNTWN